MNHAASILVGRLREPIRRMLELGHRQRGPVERLATMTNSELEAFLKSKPHA